MLYKESAGNESMQSKSKSVELWYYALAYALSLCFKTTRLAVEALLWQLVYEVEHAEVLKAAIIKTAQGTI